MQGAFRCFLIFLFFIFFQPAKAQPQCTEAERLHILTNHIRSIKVYSLKLNRDIDKRTFLDYRLNYDRSGNMTEQICYDSTDLEMMKWTNLYDGQRLKGRVFCYYRDTLLKTSIRYTNKGFPESERSENGEGEEMFRFTYICNPKGQIIESKEDFFPACNSFVKMAYKFDQQGYILLRYLGETKNASHLHYTYEYDKSGALRLITEHGMDTLASGAISFDYVKSGFLKTFSVKHENGKRFKIFYTLDPHGYLKEESKNLYLNTVLLDQEKNDFTTDSKGNITKRLRYRMNNELYKLYNYTYEYFD
jgi:hypothetical protein